VQALPYRAYHMDSPEVSTQSRVPLAFPPRAYDPYGHSDDTSMAPYYMIMLFLVEPHAEFFLILPDGAEPAENRSPGLLLAL